MLEYEPKLPLEVLIVASSLRYGYFSKIVSKSPSFWTLASVKLTVSFSPVYLV